MYPKKQKLIILGGKSHSDLFMNKKLNFHVIGIGCGQNFILIKNILVIQELF